jgi:hypothetical protein
MFSVEFEALLVNARFPATAPLDCGEKSRLKVVLCPAFKVTGKLRPVMLKPLPVTLACEIVTLDAPEFVRVSESVFEFPVCTLPKLRLAGFGLRGPGGRTPVPVNGTVRVGLDPLEVIERLPLKLPPDDGVNFSVKLVL